IAQENMEMSGRWDMDREEYPQIVVGKGYSFMAMDNHYASGKCVDLIHEYVSYMQNTNRDYRAFAIVTFLANHAIFEGDIEEYRKNIDTAGELLKEIADFSKYIITLPHYLVALRRYPDPKRINSDLDYLIEICRRDNLPLRQASLFYKSKIELAMFSGDNDTAYELGIELLSLFESSNKARLDLIESAESRYKKAKEDERHEQELFEKNEQLRSGIDKARSENEAKTNFISSMSHEIRTPINAVLGLDEMILRESTEESVKTYARDIMSAGKNLLSIVNDILDFSKIEAGKMEIVPEEYNIVDMIRTLMNLVLPRAKGKELEVKLDISHEIPTILYGDDVRIQQVITNLLTNAVKYTEEGYVEFKLDFRAIDEDKGSLLVSVKDTGIGMKEEELDKLFKPFERMDMNRNRTVEGTGLGMSIVLQLLKQMGSNLKIESVYGEGSTFSFVLEQGIVDATPLGIIDTEKLENPVEEIDEALFTAHRARVLAIDDTAVNLTVVKGLLKRTGVILDTGESGEQCLEMCKINKYDVILLDHRMPGLDGVETLKLLRAEAGLNRDVPVVALTANAMPGIDEFYEENGFAGYLAKPVNGAKLEKMLYHLLPKDVLDTEEDLILLVDTEEGIKACGDENTYLQVVKDTVTNENMIVDELNSFIANKDIKNYTIKVHALKNTARMIGATGVSAEALYLEKCGDSGRDELIYKKEGELIDHFRKVIAILKERYNLGTADLPDIEPSMLKEMLEVMVEFVKGFDFDRADEVLAELRGYNVPSGMSESFEKMGNALYNYDADSVINFAKECLEKM
ncbi:MAG: response regulator, partial [Lachnospiraceae bacterium]|nr:response regulator [Lachnospiraceae bacterium]